MAANVGAPTSAKALAREKVKGLWIAIPTPLTSDGGHVDALAASVEHYVDGLRVDGIFCGGVMGEFWALSLQERKRVHGLVAGQAGGRVPVMAQVGHHVFSDMLELCEHAIAHGIGFGIAMNPYYPPAPPPESVRAWSDASERHWLELHTEHGFQALMSTPALALLQRPDDLPILEYTRLADSGALAEARELRDRLGPAQ